MSLRGWHTNGDICANINCAVPHYASAAGAAEGRHQLEQARRDVMPPTLEIGLIRRSPEDKAAYLLGQRRRIEAEGGDLVAFDALMSVVDGEPLGEWITRRATEIAEAFHEAYERLAQDHGYVTRERSRVPWEDVPEDNKGLMIDTAADLLKAGKIK